jgi:hypothetical protein
MLQRSEPLPRRLYLEWVEEQIETYKDSVSRSELIRIAEEAVDELRMNGGGQYQLTEILLCDAVDRRIFELLGLPEFRVWSRDRRRARAPRARVADPPMPR